jgi:hypothetical protein
VTVRSWKSLLHWIGRRAVAAPLMIEPDPAVLEAWRALLQKPRKG